MYSAAHDIHGFVHRLQPCTPARSPAFLQTALDVPRFCITAGTPESGIALEEGVDPAVTGALAAAGHAIAQPCVSGHARSLFGRGQIIYRDPASGVLWAGSDGRGDGCAMAY